MGAYEDFFKDTRVSWLRKANPQKYFKAFGQVFDELINRGVTALKTSRIEQCDISALDAHARNSNLKRARNEADESLRAYLKTRWETWAAAGTEKRIVAALRRIGFKNVKVVSWYDLILRGVPSPFGGGYQTIAGVNPNGGVSYVYAGRTDISNTSPYIVRHKLGIGSKVYFITDPTETYLDVYIPPGITAKQVALEINTRVISGLPYSKYVGATATGDGTGAPGLGDVTLTVPYWSYFYVEIGAPNGFLPSFLWDDGTDTTYDYPAIHPAAWHNVARPSSDDLYAIWGTANNDIWVVGFNAKIYHYDGTAWTAAVNPTTKSMNALWGNASNNIWAVGATGTILHYDGTNWSSVVSPTTDVLTAIWGTASNNIWAVGDKGTILHYDGTNWADGGSTGGIFDTFYDIWGSGPNDIWAVGGLANINKVYHYDGTSWSIVTTPMSVFNTIQGVFGFSASDIWFVGTAGKILHYDGVSFAVIASPTTDSIQSIWGSASNDIWAGTFTGEILHYNGTSWTIDTTAAGGVNGIWGFAANDVWAVRVGGNIDRYSEYPITVKIFSGATGVLWDGGACWDLQEPYSGAIDDIIDEIRKWKSPGTSCRFLSIQTGPNWTTVPVCEDVEYDANGNLMKDFYSQNY
jgi:hypothetical protein